MNISKLKEAWLAGDYRVVRFSNVFGFIQFCWEHKMTPDNSVTEYDEKEGKMYLIRKEYENEFN